MVNALRFNPAIGVVPPSVALTFAPPVALHYPVMTFGKGNKSERESNASRLLGDFFIKSSP